MTNLVYVSTRVQVDMSERSRADTTSAEDKSIGFDYQYYYFLNELLNLKSGQIVGLEVLDDVHVERPDGSVLLIQLKHTVQKNAHQAPINLTTMDSDMWKSLSNWCKLIVDPVEGREDVRSQVRYVENTVFLLATNKSDNDTNALLKASKAFRAGEKSHAALLTDISLLMSESKDAKIRAYMGDVLKLDALVSEAFFNRLEFALGKDEIIDECKQSIAAKQIDASRIDEVFSSVDSHVRQDSFAAVKAGKKISINFDQFTGRYRRHFDKARSGLLPFKEIPAELPENLSEQTFIRQLIDIDDLEDGDVEAMAQFTTRRLHFRDNMERLIQDGLITQSEIDELLEDATLMWEGKFREAYPPTRTKSDETVSARGILSDLRQKKLTLASQNLPMAMSNGGFYDLSDRPVIGWLSNWKDRYI